jgi:hypothetical protein
MPVNTESELRIKNPAKSSFISEIFDTLSKANKLQPITRHQILSILTIQKNHPGNPGNPQIPAQPIPKNPGNPRLSWKLSAWRSHRFMMQKVPSIINPTIRKIQRIWY